MGRARDLAAFVSNADGDIKFDTDTLFIDSSANRVGIGTSSPSSVLHVSSSDPELILTDTDSNVDHSLDGNSGTGVLRLHVDKNSEGSGPAYIVNMAGSEAVRIDSDGDLGIGEANPTSRLTVAKESSRTNDTENMIRIAHSTSGTSAEGFGSKIAFIGERSNGTAQAQGNIGFVADVNTSSNLSSAFIVDTAAAGVSSERMRVDSSGNLKMNTSSLDIRSSNTNEGFVYRAGLSLDISAHNDTVLNVNRMSSNGNSTEFRRGGTVVGSVSVTTSATSFNTSSDYRLKENVSNISDGITRVKQLAPKRFNFIADADTTVDGFLAHEAATVVPEAVTGTKDEVDDNGDAVMQGIDQSKLVPLLTAALQEAISKIETLETKVAALESG